MSSLRPRKLPKNRTSSHGCFRFDRVFGQWGLRVQRSSGTTDATEFATRNQLLTQLATRGRREILELFATGLIDMQAIVDADANGDWNSLINAATEPAPSETRLSSKAQRLTAKIRQGSSPASVGVSPLVLTPANSLRVAVSDPRDRQLWHTMIELVIPGLETGAETSRRYATSLQKLRRKLRTFALPNRDDVLSDPSFFKWCREITSSTPLELDAALLTQMLDKVVDAMRYMATDAATVADLELLPRWAWRVLQQQWAASAADWNHMRRALSAVLTGLFGTVSHPTRGMILHNVPTDDEHPRVPDLTPAKFRDILSYMPEHLRDAPWVLVITGMRMREYMTLNSSHLRPNTHSIAVPGTKTRASRGTVHVAPNQWATVVGAVPAPCKAKVLRAAWSAACIEAGVPEVRLQDRKSVV